VFFFLKVHCNTFFFVGPYQELVFLKGAMSNVAVFLEGRQRQKFQFVEGDNVRLCFFLFDQVEAKYAFAVVGGGGMAMSDSTLFFVGWQLQSLLSFGNARLCCLCERQCKN
jgi:hypothetical protein